MRHEGIKVCRSREEFCLSFPASSSVSPLTAWFQVSTCIYRRTAEDTMRQLYHRPTDWYGGGGHLLSEYAQSNLSLKQWWQHNKSAISLNISPTTELPIYTSADLQDGCFSSVACEWRAPSAWVLFHLTIHLRFSPAMAEQMFTEEKLNGLKGNCL